MTRWGIRCAVVRAPEAVVPGNQPASSGVTLSLRRAVLLFAVYALLVVPAELLVGRSSESLKESAANALTGFILPVALGIVAVLAIGRRWRVREVFSERAELRISRPRWLWLGLCLFALAVAISLATAPWNDWAADVILLLVVGMLLVGVGEELVFRGFLLVGARTRFSEPGACLFTCALFGLYHGINVLTGQALGATLGQMAYAAVLGAVFYLLRRVSGVLAVPMLVHGLIDVMYVVQAPPG